MATEHYLSAIVKLVAKEQAGGSTGVPPRTIAAHIGSPRPTVNRALAELTNSGRLERFGAGRSTLYRVPLAGAGVAAPAEEAQPELARSPAAKSLLAQLSAPMASRQPVSYQRSFVDVYKPNESTLLPAGLAVQLYEAGRSKDQQPAGTYARKVLEQLLIDLSWFSSRLEGNRISLPATRDLFEKGRSENDDRDATML
jgi:hypothetical protein